MKLNVFFDYAETIKIQRSTQIMKLKKTSTEISKTNAMEKIHLYFILPMMAIAIQMGKRQVNKHILTIFYLFFI